MYYKHLHVLLLIFLILLSTSAWSQKISISAQNPPINYSYGTHFYNGPIFGPNNGFHHVIANPLDFNNLCRIVRIPDSGIEFGQAVYVDVILKIKLEKNGFTIPHGPDCTNPQIDYTQDQAAIVLTVDVSIRKLSNDQLIHKYVRYEIDNVSHNLDIYGMRSYNIGEENNPPEWSDFLEQHIRMLPTNLDPGCCGDAVILDQKTQTYLKGSQLVTLNNIQLRGDSGGTDLSPDFNCGGDHRIDFINFNDYLEIWVSDDFDGDGIPDQGFPPTGVVFDNCPNIPNTSQANSDNDLHGNACDNCPFISNNNQQDSDGDLIGDTCDNCALISNALQTNSDFDNIGDDCDNCPQITNQDQSDFDNDGIGDACDFEDCPIENIFQIQGNSFNSSPFSTDKVASYLIYYDQSRVNIGDIISYSNPFGLNSSVSITDYPQQITSVSSFGVGNPFRLNIEFSSVSECTYPLMGIATISNNLNLTCPTQVTDYCTSSNNYIIDFTNGNISNNCTGPLQIKYLIYRSTGLSIPFTFQGNKLYFELDLDLGLHEFTVVSQNECNVIQSCDILIQTKECTNCPTSYDIEAPVSENFSFYASDYISISTSVNQLSSVECFAGNYVELKPGTSIELNSEFLADIAPCINDEICIIECECDNGIDDDGDGLIDCIDDDCAFNTICNCSPNINDYNCPINPMVALNNNGIIEVSVYELIDLSCIGNYSASFSDDGTELSQTYTCASEGDVQIAIYIFQAGNIIDTCFQILTVNGGNACN